MLWKYAANLQENPMSKCDLNKVTLQLYWNRISAWVFSCKFTTYFQNIFSWEHLWVAASDVKMETTRGPFSSIVKHFQFLCRRIVIFGVLLLLLMLEFLAKSTKNNAPFIYNCKFYFGWSRTPSFRENK